jgi:hypothetical protein
MPVQYLSGAQYARRLLNDPTEEVQGLLGQVLAFLGTEGDLDQGAGILIQIDIYNGLGFECDDPVTADVMVQLKHWPDAMERLWGKFKAGDLVYEVVSQEAAVGGRIPEFGINVRVKDGTYVAAHVSRHPRLDCVLLHFC